ncbi:MAG: hypothetical protein H0W64_11020 [Gammaproteobacteria bacterium]|nr:hypothetical protein [Gammaproteobacteria bacterium]
MLLKNATTIAKTGFFLEQRPSHFAVDENQLKKLVPYIPKQPHYMNRDQQGKGKLFEKWQLIVPLAIVNRTWEEPDVPNI